MAPRIKAIPTVYAGVQFRSRLEARWAMFLELLGVRWLYEAEGFQCKAGWYVPDFRLIDLATWLEIKPREIDDAAADLAADKLSEVAQTTRTRGLLFFGEPLYWLERVDADWLWGFEVRETVLVDGVGGGDDSYVPCVCPGCGRVGFEYEGRGARVCWTPPGSNRRACGWDPGGYDDRSYTFNDPRIIRAGQLANNYRFAF